MVLVKEMISDKIPSLRLKDSGREALTLMEAFRVDHLAVADGKEYIGTIAERSVYRQNLLDQVMTDCREYMSHPVIYTRQHIYEIIPVFMDWKISVLPVLDEDSAYQGVVSVFDLMERFAGLVNMEEPGGIIVLEMNPRDYSLAQIARIVEENDAKILSLYLSKAGQFSTIRVTLKLNITDLSSVIQSFMRFNYTVYGVFEDDSRIKDLYSDRYDQFMKYMNI